MDFSMMKDYMNRLCEWIIPGNSICVYHDNKEIFRYSAGFSELETKTPMQGDELLNMYSCTKVATVVAALQLYERGFFLLDDPLYDFMPEFRHMQVMQPDGTLCEAKNPITMRNLFTMSAGFTYDTQSPQLLRGEKETNGRMPTREMMKYLALEPLEFEPGERWRYSLCHDVLAAAVEVISGEKYSEYLINRVLKPCGIKEAYFKRDDAVKARMAAQYEYKTGITDHVIAQQTARCGDGVLVNVGKDIDFAMWSEYESGGAGLVLSVPEYAKFADALACGGRTSVGERILSDGTVDLLRTNQLTEKMMPSFKWVQMKGYGYGLGVRTLIDRAAAGFCGKSGEFGWGGAAGATLLSDPDTGFSYCYAHHMLNPQEAYYQPRLRNVAYACFMR